MTEPNVTLADFIAQLKQTIARGGQGGEILESLKKILDVKYTLVQANYVEGEEKTMLDYDKYSILGNIASGDSAENALRYIIDSLELNGVTDENRAIFDSLSALLVKKMNERRWIKAVFNGDDFGERLSQYAALLSTSAKLKIKPVLDPALWPPLRISDNEVHTDDYMTQLFGDLPHVSIAMMNSYPTIKTQQPPENFRKFGEISLADQQIFNIILAGKYQAQGYWRDGGEIEAAIRKRFTPSSMYLDEIKRLRSLTSTSAFLFEGYDECAKETFVKLNPSATFINISKTTSPLEQLAIAIQCPLGGVCNETMTAWWGAMLNTSPNKLVFSPHHDIDLVKTDFITPGIGVIPAKRVDMFVRSANDESWKRFNVLADYANISSIANVKKVDSTLDIINETIIVVDDDIVFAPDICSLLESLINVSSQNPNTMFLFNGTKVGERIATMTLTNNTHTDIYNSQQSTTNYILTRTAMDADIKYVTVESIVSKYRQLQFPDKFPIIANLPSTPHDVIYYDIGANVGDWANTNLNMCSKMIIVEPNRKLLPYLHNRFSSEIKTGKVEIVPYIISNKDGVTKFYDCTENSGLSTTKEDWLSSETSRFNGVKYSVVEYPSMTLKSMMSKYPRPSLLKIDVESAEYDVISTLDEKIDTICFEWASEAKDVALKCIDHLSSLGYEKFMVQHQDEYSYRPSEYMNSDDVKLVIATSIPKVDWGMIWCKA